MALKKRDCHFFKKEKPAYEAKEMAARVEETANKMEQEGFELVSCSITPSSKGILVFRRSGEPAQEKWFFLIAKGKSA